MVKAGERVTVGRRERKKEETRRAILSAAANLFSQRGYEASSIDEIAEAADVDLSIKLWH